MARKKNPTVAASTAVQNAQPVQNGLAEAVGMGLGGGNNPFGFPGNQGSPYTEQISQPTTVFKNLRWWLVSNLRQMLSEAYVELGLVQTICDVPVDDALRGGIELKSEQLDETQIKELIDSLDRDDDLNIVGTAAKWNRLFGGAGVIVLTDQDPAEPLDLEGLNEDSPLEFRAVDLWELFWDKQNTEGYDPTIQQETFSHYNYYGEQIHKSRVMPMKGLTAPSFIRPRLRGWGFSVVEVLIRSINQYLKGTDLAFEVMDEFKVDVYKIENLVNTLMSSNGDAKVARRVQIMNFQKNYQNAVVLDKNDDWDHKQLSFAGLSEAMQQVRMQVASDMRMPMIKLFGQQAGAGIGNTGEDEIEVYNSMVESQVRNKIKYILLRVCEIKSQKLFGFVPDDLSLAFKPLRVLSAVDEENVKTQKFTRLMQAKQLGEIDSKDFRDACNKENLLGITLSKTGLDPSGGFDQDDVDEGDNDPSDPKDTSDPGADRADSSKPTATQRGGAPKGLSKPDSDKPASASADKQTDKARPVKQVNADKWDESKHPRADDGKFGEGGGGGEVHHSTYEKFSAKDIKPSKGGYFGEGFYVHRDKEATQQYGDSTHTYSLAEKPVFDLSGDKLKPDAVKVFKDMGLDVEKITTPSQFMKPVQKALSEIRKKFPGEETVGNGAMEKLRSFLKEKGYIGIQFSHNDTDENMVIFDKKDLAPGGKSEEGTKDKKSLSTIADNGQIAFKKPKTLDEASQLLEEIGGHVEKASKDFEANGDKGGAGLRLRHAVQQQSRVVGLVKKLVAEKSTKNDLELFAEFFEIEPYTRFEKTIRLTNSAQFDKASYEADGGDHWVSDDRARLLAEVTPSNPALWEKACAASQAAYGEKRIKFVAWMYVKLGGRL